MEFTNMALWAEIIQIPIFVEIFMKWGKNNMHDGVKVYKWKNLKHFYVYFIVIS